MLTVEHQCSAPHFAGNISVKDHTGLHMTPASSSCSWKAMLSVKSDFPAVWNFISPPCPSLLIAFWGVGQSYSYIEYSLRYDEKPWLKNFPVLSLTLGDELTYLRLTQHFFPVEEIFQTFKIILGIQVPIKSKLIHSVLIYPRRR